ncbi:hypothetical protein AVEN_256921-1 [Araneus ventricosus]|uniref:Pre-C2HC domain-containing protein n=1 Tax=Araneus ventricosus TaxID=182803 RepID=A0A4Y2CG42_ARAVE|nr:hypothetical protein AVEN_256921-1 [Araneus ventricosus]
MIQSNAKEFYKTSLTFLSTKLSNWLNYERGYPLSFFLIELNKTENVGKIYDIKHLNYLNVTVVPFRGRNMVNQCYKCNYFHHNADCCKIKPNRLKCKGPHQRNQRNIIEKAEKPNCINCGKIGRVASYRGCEKFPKPPTAQQNRQNYHHSARRTFNANQENQSINESMKMPHSLNFFTHQKKNRWHHQMI